MATYRFIDYNELASKPDTVDVFAIYDIDANELKKFSYATLKAQFVKVDEDTDVSATVEFQQNKKLKFANAGEFEIYSDATDLFIKGTSAAGKLRFFANSAEILTLDPVAGSIATLGKAINKDGTTLKGVYFNASNEMVLYNRIVCTGAGIALAAKNLSYTAANDTGLEFDVSNNATFYGSVGVQSTISATGAITSTNSGGYGFSTTGDIRCGSGKSFYAWGSQGLSGGFDFVSDIRWHGAVLEYLPGNVTFAGGIYSNLTIAPFWTTVP